MHELIESHVRAGFAGLYLVTHEEIRAEGDLRTVAEKLGYGLHIWSVAAGLLNVQAKSVRADLTDPVDAVNAAADLPEKTLLVLRDFHQFLGDGGQPASPLVTRSLKDRLRECRGRNKVVLVTACCVRLPPELRKEFTVLTMPLPDAGVLRGLAAGLAESAGLAADDAALDAAADAARGLTTPEAEDILALSVVRRGRLEPAFIADEKARAIGKDGILEIVEAKAALDDVGGLAGLKGWLSRRRHAFSREAAEFGLPPPKGILILGIPGTGKSLTAKAVSSVLGVPLLKLDAGRLFGGLVGESEANLRHALQTAEAVSPCILWMDELEKALSGAKSSGMTDGGTSARVFGGMLSWMQDKTAPVFVVATANDVGQLPPELLRKGRFDELFFVDLPGQEERESIFAIHLRKRGRRPSEFDLKALGAASGQFTGAEIEQAVIDALFDCFDRGRKLDQKALGEAVSRTVPLSRTMAEELARLRRWAEGRTRPAGADREAGAGQHRALLPAAALPGSTN